MPRKGDKIAPAWFEAGHERFGWTDDSTIDECLADMTKAIIELENQGCSCRDGDGEPICHGM